ncbi:MAG: photosystem I reaction center subunit XII [Novosphingobium sp.]|nr:hypothetical protein [Novosphingobium sp.]
MNWDWLDADWVPWGETMLAALLVAMLALWRERQRRQRSDPDAVGIVAWDTVFVLALFVALLAGILAYREAL